MLTIFSIPKPFQGNISIIQGNAIESWVRLVPTCEVILCGNEPGVARIAAELGIRHIADIVCNEYGTPLLSNAFEQVCALAHHEVLCYVNGDIIFLDDLVGAVRQIDFTQFLLVGQRWNVDIAEPIEFVPGWEHEVRARAIDKGKLAPIDHIDYFVFPKNSIPSLPEFAVGRPGWDNWMIYHARVRRVPVIDGTCAVSAIHQNHAYGHVPQSSGARWEGPEADKNRALMGGKAHRFYITDATHKLMPGGKLVKALDDVYLERRASRQAILSNRSDAITRFLHRCIGWIGRHRSGFLPRWAWRILIDTLAR
jgi:hypothetical protein